MSFSDISSRDAILDAVEEFDQIGRVAFLAKYGYGRAREYLLVYNGCLYDSKAIVGVAHGYEYPHKGPLKFDEFVGGKHTVKPKLEQLGFKVRVGYDDILYGLEKIRRDSRMIRDLWKFGVDGPFRGGVGVVPPAPVNKVMPTLYIIVASSTLDSALKTYLFINDPNAPRKKTNSLGNRIKYLDRKGKFKAGSRLKDLQNTRNRYAHELDQYGTWEEMDRLLSMIEYELKHLRIM